MKLCTPRGTQGNNSITCMHEREVSLFWALCLIFFFFIMRFFKFLFNAAPSSSLHDLCIHKIPATVLHSMKSSTLKLANIYYRGWRQQNILSFNKCYTPGDYRRTHITLTLQCYEDKTHIFIRRRFSSASNPSIDLDVSALLFSFFLCLNFYLSGNIHANNFH